jgi:hypothetical protein
LIRRADDGREDVVATSVLAYDLLADGSVVYSNGTAIFHRDPAGGVTEVCTGKLIERVVAVG